MSKSILMCAPDYFDIEYEINPWMSTENQIDHKQAAKEWKQLYSIYTDTLGWDVQLIKPVKGLPDMVFTANGALIYKDKVALPHFRQPDRQPETELFKQWFQEAGFNDFYLPKYDFEGEGDALFWNDILFAGYPWRTDRPAHAELAEYFGVKVVGLQLADARFYHLDTALTIIDNETVALYPGTFAPEALKTIHNLVPNVIEGTAEDGQVYGFNAMSDGHNIVLPDRAHGLIKRYKEHGMEVHPCAIAEYQKSGGGVKCLTLKLNQDF